MLLATDFSDYLDWIAISAACHDATNGTGFLEWADWCRTDPKYADQSNDALQAKWDTFVAGKAGGATFRKLLWAVVQAGHKDMLAKMGHDFSEDFPDEDLADFAPWDETNDR